MSTAKTVRLAELDYDPVVLAMPGQEARLEKVDDLKASIAAEGLLQSLKVRTDPDATRYLVTAGLRRLTALKWLRDHGGTMLGQPVTDDTQIAVIYSEETDDAARRQAVAENVQRVALTVGAEVRQFAELARTETPAAIAARFGVSEKRVQQRLKLAGLHPDVLEALDAGKISIKAAEAFTVEEDPAKQAKYLKKNGSSSYNLDPHRIREAFTKKLVRSDSAIALHIGADDYAAAGGLTMEDPFSDAVYWISDDIIERLAVEKTAAQVEAWKAEGWSFVESIDEFGGDWWGVFYGRKLRPEGEGETAAFTPEQKALSGVVYFPDFSRATVRGVVKKDTVLPDDNRPKTQPVGSLHAPGHEALTAMRVGLTAWQAERLSADPLLALRVLVAQLHAQVFEENWSDYDPFQVTAEFTVEVGDGETPPEQGLTFAEVFTWAQSADTEALTRHLAKLLSFGVAVDGSARQRLVLEAMGPIIFDPEPYFAALSKPLIALAYEDITGKKLKDGKLETMAGKAIVEAKAQGWLPPQLRTASYAGPCHVTPPPTAEADEQDDGLGPDDEEGFDEDDDAQREAAE